MNSKAYLDKTKCQRLKVKNNTLVIFLKSQKNLSEF